MTIAADWNPDLYTRFEDERTRPARDLLARCRLAPAPARPRILDLGCGPGNSTELLAERFPDADILGIDTSEAMLRAARERLPQCRFERGDIASLSGDGLFDLVYANASLQWVLGHDALIPRLLRLVAPNGLFAAQIPDNLADPSQTEMRRIAAEPSFAETLAEQAEGRELIGSSADYYDLLRPDAAEVDVWTTIYEHPMEDAAAITRWFRSTGLKPFVDPLPERERDRFLERYTAAMERAYPARIDGRRLLAFRRLFMVARRAQA
ncbi:trans-aconitate 2-methyltransferase [Aureimonas jatrophae]|uniref:Trans-aconitate 2-methyltransferase n=1 Tax=Aureimonas jatrophae TaxID=1166073 RepID=A0A1H0ICJ3_9HYPH|nr:trans-aconitate 2-methyltransferase [Aureimonas jatrophae]MBB3952093.1 trans-aconitate 2-methyltransferase [Aureimonas jatrophae]SDO29086.1 trans-aconitate 2-methyltransferase [Aureimonas jatrophae]